MSQDLFGKESSSKKPPSSIAYKTVTNYLESFQDSSVPSHIDRSVLPVSMSGGNQAYLVSASKFLGFISEDGVTDENFHRFVKGNKEERIAAWREILTSSYDFVFKDLDIERTTTTIVSGRFKEQGISGDSIRKAMTFFLFAAKDAELKISPHIKAVQARNKTVRPRKSDARQEEDSQETSNGSAAKPPETKPPMVKIEKSPFDVLIEILNVDMEEDEQMAVWTLIRYLKKKQAESE